MLQYIGSNAITGVQAPVLPGLGLGKSRMPLACARVGFWLGRGAESFRDGLSAVSVVLLAAACGPLAAGPGSACARLCAPWGGSTLKGVGANRSLRHRTDLAEQCGYTLRMALSPLLRYPRRLTEDNS